MHGSEHRTHTDDMPLPAPDRAAGAARRRRNRRPGWATRAVAAGAVVSAVALTGCGTNEEEPPPPQSVAASAPLPGTAATAPGAPETPGPGTAAGPLSAPATVQPGAAAGNSGADRPGKTTSGTGGTKGAQGANAPQTVAPCTPEVLAVSSQKEPADATEIRHILITVQNAGSATCDLYRHPYVLLGDAQGPAPVIEESDPDPGVPVTLAPGDEAYAAMVLNGPMDEYPVNSISLTLQGSTPGSRTGGPMDVPLPGPAPLYANDFQRVTYWTTAPGLALDFVMSR